VIVIDACTRGLSSAQRGLCQHRFVNKDRCATLLSLCSNVIIVEMIKGLIVKCGNWEDGCKEAFPLGVELCADVSRQTVGTVVTPL
jgi:hypothetical protein